MSKLNKKSLVGLGALAGIVGTGYVLGKKIYNKYRKNENSDYFNEFNEYNELFEDFLEEDIKQYEYLLNKLNNDIKLSEITSKVNVVSISEEGIIEVDCLVRQDSIKYHSLIVVPTLVSNRIIEILQEENTYFNELGSTLIIEVGLNLLDDDYFTQYTCFVSDGVLDSVTEVENTISDTFSPFIGISEDDSEMERVFETEEDNFFNNLSDNQTRNKRGFHLKRK